jgi:hypothetical protein
MCLTTRCLFDYTLHPNVTISHITRAYIRERTRKRNGTTNEKRRKQKDTEREKVTEKKVVCCSTKTKGCRIKGHPLSHAASICPVTSG